MFDEAWSTANGRGGLLLQNLDGTVRLDPPFVLACECRGLALDHAIARVSLFAFALSAIVGAIVVVGAAPWPMLSISMVWAGAGGVARVFAARRRREHGRFLIDFERDVVVHAPDRAAARDVALGRGASVRVDRSTDHTAPFWVIVETAGKPLVRMRIARGKPEEIEGLLRMFRQYHYGVNRKVLDEWEEARAEE